MVVETRMSRFTIPECPRSLNVQMRWHWGLRRAYSEQWQWYLRTNKLLWQELSVKAKVKITLMHSRLYDKDNAYGACKVLVDAMKKQRLIVDDTAEWLDLEVQQGKEPHKSRYTIVEIELA